MRRLTLALVLVAMTGCAADGSEGVLDGTDDAPAGDPNAAEPSSPVDPSSGATESATVEAIAASGLIDSEEAAFLTLINNYRHDHGAAALRISVALSHSAQGHSTDMANHNYFEHNSQDGTTPFQRMTAAGYPSNTYEGENIAAGYADAMNTFVQWRDACDPDASGACTYEHRQNMLNTHYTVIGIGRANNTTSTYGWYWTTDFGSAVDAVLSYGTGSIIANGGFEGATAGTASWSAVRTRGNWYTSNAARSTSGPQAGSYEMTVHDPSTGGASATQIALAAPGIAYTFTASSLRTAGSTGQSLYLEFLDGNYARLEAHAAASHAASPYAAASVGAVAPAHTRYVRVFLYGSGASGTSSSYRYDSAKLTAQ